MAEIAREIILKAREGDIASFEEIYRAVSGFVYNVALRVVGNAEDAAEAAQDAFVKVHRNLKNFEHRSSFKTWVYRITVNAALNYRRSRVKHTRGRADYDDALEHADPQENVRDKLDREDREMKLRGLLNSLDEDQRVCIILREIQGLDYKEIAETLRINLNTVRSRLKRAREKLFALAQKG
jgi:RNA polymerase sigma-70 factor (ECF subfamily)